MAITYTWNFGPLEVALSEDGMTNVVKTVHWRLTGVDGSHSETVYGSEGMDTPVPENFIDYEDITKEDVTAWIESKLGTERLDTLKGSIASSIDLQKNPVKATLAPPWDEVQVTVVGANPPPPEPTPEPTANTANT